MKQETIICGGENCDREATHLLMSVMLQNGRIPEGFLADVASPESTFPTCPVCLEQHASKMQNLDQRLSPEVKNRYSVIVTEEKTHEFEVRGGSKEEARETATDLFLRDDPDHDNYDHTFYIEDEDVRMLEDEPAASVTVAGS